MTDGLSYGIKINNKHEAFSHKHSNRMVCSFRLLLSLTETPCMYSYDMSGIYLWYLSCPEYGCDMSVICLFYIHMWYMWHIYAGHPPQPWQYSAGNWETRNIVIANIIYTIDKTISIVFRLVFTHIFIWGQTKYMAEYSMYSKIVTTTTTTQCNTTSTQWLG